MTVGTRPLRKRVWWAIAPLYAQHHAIYGDWDEYGHEGAGRRAAWWYDVRHVAFGYMISTRAEHRDQGMSFEGWRLEVYLGPITLEVHGADQLEDDES